VLNSNFSQIQFRNIYKFGVPLIQSNNYKIVRKLKLKWKSDRKKLYIMKNWTKLVFKSFSFEARKIEKILFYRKVPKNFRNCKQVPGALFLNPFSLRHTVRSRWMSSTVSRPASGNTAPGFAKSAPPWQPVRPTRAPGLSSRHHDTHGLRQRRRWLDAPGRGIADRLNPPPTSLALLRSIPVYKYPL
jgi:hypothetical protein